MKENTGKTKYVILGLLSHCPQTGYSIKKSIEFEYSHFWQESFGQIYPTLKALVSEGLAVSSDILESSDGRGQIVYNITEAGRAELEKWLSEAPDVEKIRYEILLKISFGTNTQSQVLLGHLDDFIERNEKTVSELDGYIEIFHVLKAQGEDHTFNELTALCGKYVYSAMRDWALDAKRIITERGEKQ
ncbi:MAG: PadR family transcriptional regulator [Firmicutes bacterium HGW-Firmicutes-16]|nr:MAG: PadR family transcriptional regulator [Firmicutes bacterium HGW-Firmicutes-16]